MIFVIFYYLQLSCLKEYKQLLALRKSQHSKEILYLFKI